MIHRINSRSNQKLKSLLAGKDRYFFFEGEKLVKDLLGKNVLISKLIINQKNESRFEITSKKIEEIWIVNDSVMKKISALKDTSDFIAVVKYVPKKIDFGKIRIGIVLDNVQDPRNAGSIFRCAAAFGINSILFSGDCVKLNNPKLLRTAQTSVFDVDFQHFPNLENIFERCQKKKTKIYLTSSDISLGGTKIQDVFLPCFIVFGNEGKGLKKDLFDQFPSIHIPQKKAIESLNVGISACIIMYELSKH